MTDVADLQADLAKLKKIRGTGVLKVRLADGKETTFVSGADLQARIDSIQSEINQLSSRPKARTGYASFDRN